MGSLEKASSFVQTKNGSCDWASQDDLTAAGKWKKALEAAADKSKEGLEGAEKTGK